MRALMITAPGEAAVHDVDPPVAAPGEVVVDVERAGICGTDAEFYSGHMAYLRSGHARFPMRIGHEWMGTVATAGQGVDPAWIGRRVMGDTMLGCDTCRRCRRGAQHVCEDRQEVGIRGHRHGALAEQVAVPASSLHHLPDTLDRALGALVEPGGNALRAVQGARLSPGDRVLIMGPGTIGLLCALFARAAGAEVHVLGLPGPGLDFARTLGLVNLWTQETLPDLPGRDHRCRDLLRAAGLGAVPGGAGRATGADRSRRGAQPDRCPRPRARGHHRRRRAERLPRPGGDHRALRRGHRADPRPLIAATIGLDQVADVLAGTRPPGSGPGPKIHIDPRRR